MIRRQCGLVIEAVDGVLHTGIHALTTGWAVNMSGVAREEDTPTFVVSHLAFVDPKRGRAGYGWAVLGARPQPNELIYCVPAHLDQGLGLGASIAPWPIVSSIGNWLGQFIEGGKA